MEKVKLNFKKQLESIKHFTEFVEETEEFTKYSKNNFTFSKVNKLNNKDDHLSIYYDCIITNVYNEDKVYVKYPTLSEVKLDDLPKIASSILNHFSKIYDEVKGDAKFYEECLRISSNYRPSQGAINMYDFEKLIKIVNTSDVDTEPIFKDKSVDYNSTLLNNSEFNDLLLKFLKAHTNDTSVLKDLQSSIYDKNIKNESDTEKDGLKNSEESTEDLKKLSSKKIFEKILNDLDSKDYSSFMPKLKIVTDRLEDSIKNFELDYKPSLYDNSITLYKVKTIERIKNIIEEYKTGIDSIISKKDSLIKEADKETKFTRRLAFSIDVDKKISEVLETILDKTIKESRLKVLYNLPLDEDPVNLEKCDCLSCIIEDKINAIISM